MIEENRQEYNSFKGLVLLIIFSTPYIYTIYQKWFVEKLSLLTVSISDWIFLLLGLISLFSLIVLTEDGSKIFIAVFPVLVILLSPMVILYIFNLDTQMLSMVVITSKLMLLFLEYIIIFPELPTHINEIKRKKVVLR